MIALYRQVPTWFSRDILLPFALTRLALTLAAWLAFHFLPLASVFPLSWEIGRDGAVQPTTQGVPEAHPFINMWSRWDAGWYLKIAKEGYHYERAKPSSSAFFPLYPLATRLLRALLFLPASDRFYLAAAILLSNLCLIGGLIFLYVLVSLDYGVRVAKETVFCILLFPTSFFFSSAYSESLFFGLSVSSFYYVRKERWLMGCILAALASLSRSQGIILIVPLIVEYFSQKQWKLRLIRWNIAGLLLMPAAVLAFVLYLRWNFGGWSILFDAQQAWGRRLLAPWYGVPWVLTHAAASAGVKNDWIDLAFLALLVIVAVVFSRCLRPSHSVYLWVAVAFFSSWGMLGSIPRLLLGIFPLFIGLALWCERNRTFRLACLIMSAVFGVFFFVMHSQWQWIA